jgi:hypothetical protein
MAWKKGPLPKGTYYWGGVILHDQPSNSGFFFAGFNDDHAVLPSVNGEPERKVLPHEIRLYDNSIQLPVPKELDELK